jgi:hypothetical protein
VARVRGGHPDVRLGHARPGGRVGNPRPHLPQ